MNIIKNSDIILKLIDYSDMPDITSVDTNIKYDWFDYYMSSIGEANVYVIEKKNIVVGYVSLYNHDCSNGSIYLYGKVSKKQYFSELLKAILYLMDYVFTSLRVNKIGFIYREDNYFFDDLCGSLHYTKEGILRNNLFVNGELYNLNVYGLLSNEYHHYQIGEYSSMFTWDTDYNPKDYISIDINDKFNCRSFTNSFNNPNYAMMNDNLKEFALNRTINHDNCLTYKNVRFPVKIFDLNSRYDSLKCQGQVIEIPDGRYKAILLIATAQFGFKEAYISLLGSDGEEVNVKFTLSDWCERVFRDEYIIHYAYGCRLLANGVSVVKGDSWLFLKKITIDNVRTINQIKLPLNRDIFIYSIVLVRN